MMFAKYCLIKSINKKLLDDKYATFIFINKYLFEMGKKYLKKDDLGHYVYRGRIVLSKD